MFKLLIIFICLNLSLLANTYVQLNEIEREWLQNHPNIKVGIDNNFAPFEFVDENGEFRGLAADYLKEMERNLNITFTVVKTKEWNEIINMTKNREIDFLSTIVKTEERAEYLNFTSPYLTFPMVIVTNKTTGFVNELADLIQKTVAVIDGYTPEQLLRQHYPNIYLVKTKDLRQSLELVSSGKTFAHVGNLPRVIHLLNEEGFQNLSISGITQFKYNFSMATRKNEPILTSILQKSFDAIPKEVKKEIYYKWFPLNYNPSTNNFKIWQIVGSLIIFMVLFFFGLYKILKEIRKRELIEKQLRKNAQWLNKSLQTANIGAWKWDLRVNVITGNSVYASILGLEIKEIEISAREFQKNFIHKDDLPFVLKELEQYLSNKVEFCSAQFRIYAKDGTLKTIESNGEIFEYDTYNNPAIMIGFIKEINN